MMLVRDSIIEVSLEVLSGEQVDGSRKFLGSMVGAPRYGKLIGMMGVEFEFEFRFKE